MAVSVGFTPGERACNTNESEPICGQLPTFSSTYRPDAKRIGKALYLLQNAIFRRAGSPRVPHTLRKTQ